MVPESRYLAQATLKETLLALLGPALQQSSFGTLARVQPFSRQFCLSNLSRKADSWGGRYCSFKSPSFPHTPLSAIQFRLATHRIITCLRSQSQQSGRDRRLEYFVGPSGVMDVSRGLENLLVTVWPRLEEPPGFQYSPDHVAAAEHRPDPSEISFLGCSCHSASCQASNCSCLPYGENYKNSCINYEGNEEYSKPIFECNIMCQCGESCQNRVIQRGLQFRLEVFKTAKKGWGLRTLNFIPKGRFVCEYAGEILDFREACRRVQQQSPSDSNYVIAIREHLCDGQMMETFVDPTYKGNVGRFLNHSCEPNLIMVPVRIDSMVPKLALFADRDICAEEELSYDYSGRHRNYLPDLQRDHEKLQGEEVKKKTCYCGAKSCTGFLPYDGSLFYEQDTTGCTKETL